MIENVLLVTDSMPSCKCCIQKLPEKNTVCLISGIWMNGSVMGACRELSLKQCEFLCVCAIRDVEVNNVAITSYAAKHSHGYEHKLVVHAK